MDAGPVAEDGMNWTTEQLAERNREVLGTVKCPCGCNYPDHWQATLPAADSVEWPEHMIERECTRLLEQDGWRSLRTDPVSDKGRGKGFGEIGMADHLYIRYVGSTPAVMARDLAAIGGGCAVSCIDNLCEVLWCEFKSAKGKPAKHQIEWHTKERARGALTLIAGVDFPASVAGFVAWYAASGLRRSVA